MPDGVNRMVLACCITYQLKDSFGFDMYTPIFYNGKQNVTLKVKAQMLIMKFLKLIKLTFTCTPNYI